MTTEITKLIPPEAQGIPLSPRGQVMLRSVGEAAGFASLMAASGMLPPKVTVPSAVVAIIAGASIGLNPFESVQSIAVVNGRPSLFGDGMKAVVQGSGQLENEERQEFRDKEGSLCAVEIRAWRKGRKTPYVGRFSVKMAKQAGLWGKVGPWQQYPDIMLETRARAYAYRNGFSDVLKGVRSAEEENDILLANEPAAALPAPPAPAAQLPKPRRTRRASAAEIIEAADNDTDAPAPALVPVAGADVPAPETMAGPDEDEFRRAS
jgi:hypothetical protein